MVYLKLITLHPKTPMIYPKHLNLLMDPPQKKVMDHLLRKVMGHPLMKAMGHPLKKAMGNPPKKIMDLQKKVMDPPKNLMVHPRTTMALQKNRPPHMDHLTSLTRMRSQNRHMKHHPLRSTNIFRQSPPLLFQILMIIR